jgi:CobQ-like glutamine amidotransferase family enzyme
MKTIEVLFSEFGNMYGEVYNPMFLEKSSNKIKLIYTKLNEEPYFMKHKVDMVYISNMRDLKMYDILDKLKEYKDKIKEMIEDNVIFLLTGNALEMFGSYIEENGKKTEALGIFDYYVEKDFEVKYASWVKGKYKNIEIIGHRNQFSKCFGIKNPFIKVSNGTGSDIDSNIEGINYKNFYATYLLGPFLIMNPLFAKHILNLLGIKDMKFEKVAMDAYKHRMEYFSKEDARYIMTHHG